MKKNFTLFLALLMIVSCIFGVMPAADSTEGGGANVESYKPEIAYANVNYSEDLVLMFAVPVPAEGALAEGSSVKLVVWEAASRIYSYKDSVSTSDTAATATAVEAEEAKVTIGGVEYLVYKYNKLDASKMTDIIYARAAVVDKDGKATAYSDVLDYSVVEYAETAKGSFSDGTPIVSDDAVELIDSLLGFGAAVQGLANNGDGHIPNGYLANEELHKIWVTPVIAGTKLVKVFGGFFKYEEGGYATVRDPFFDGYEPAVYKDAQGNVLADANPQAHEEALGFQIDAVDSDIEITVEYTHVLHRQINSADYGTDFYMSNVEKIVYGQVAKDNGAKFNDSNWAVNLRSVGGDTLRNASIEFGGSYGLSGTWFNSVKTVEDSSNPGNYLLQFTSTNAEKISINSKLSSQGKAFYGYGDTLEEAITFEIELGKPNPEANVTINGIFLRDESTWGSWAANEPYNGASGTTTYIQGNVFSYLFRVLNNDVILPGNNVKITTLPDTGLVKIAVTIHGNGELKAYYSDENGDMICAGTWEAEKAMLMCKAYKEKHAQYLTNLADNNPDNNNDLLPYKDIGTYIEMSTLGINMYTGPQGANPREYNSGTLNTRWPAEFATAKVEIDGVEVPVQSGVDASGVDASGNPIYIPIYNPIALRTYMENNYGFLMSKFTVYVGDVYGVDIADRYETYDENSDNVDLSSLALNMGGGDKNPAMITVSGDTHSREDDNC